VDGAARRGFRETRGRRPTRDCESDGLYSVTEAVAAEAVLADGIAHRGQASGRHVQHDKRADADGGGRQTGHSCRDLRI
jgi:hypothetical protein